MTSLVEYKIFCLTENSVVRGYTTELLVPICPHDNHHVVIASTLTKIAELDSANAVNYCQSTSYELTTTPKGTSGISVPYSIGTTLENISYSGQTGISGDTLKAYYTSDYGSTGIYYVDTTLEDTGASIDLNVMIPWNSLNHVEYTNNSASDRSFQFSTYYCF